MTPEPRLVAFRDMTGIHVIEADLSDTMRREAQAP